SASEIKALYERGLNTIVAEETSPGEEWKCSVTLNDGINDSITKSSSISVLEKKPEEKPEEEVRPSAGGGGRRRRGCFERWNCTEWGPCINGTQTRICYDIGTCKKPPRTETRECVVQPTPAPAPPAKPMPPARLVPPVRPEVEIEKPLLPQISLYKLLIVTLVVVTSIVLIIWALKKHFAYEGEIAEGLRIRPEEEIVRKGKLFEEAAVITEPERRLRERIAFEKEREEKILKEALEERKRELERIKREERERRMRVLEERRKLKERIHRISHTLNEFILRGITQGMSKQEIKTLLIDAGWDEKFIEKYVDKFFKLNAALIIRLRRKRSQ
ncbi:hypothetical protein DRZ77_02670, partial [Candidatus Woesearchaeota archaeon]